MIQIKRYCYFPKNKPRVWWWKILNYCGDIIADGFSSRKEAEEWLAASQIKNDDA